MFQDTVTIFNQQDNIWHSTVLKGVEAQEVTAQNTSKDGKSSKNQCNLHIPERLMKSYVRPKEWNCDGYTLRSDDFFAIGDYGEMQINDDDYEVGYQDYMKNNHDGVYQVSSVSVLKLIKHIEVVGE